MGRDLIYEKHKKYGRLLVVDLSDKPSKASRYWKCLCDCGRVIDIQGTRLRSGKIMDCGCGKSERLRKAATVHGLSKSPTWYSWKSMRDRCLNPNVSNYETYGGRGIRVCERWSDSFEAFLQDMGERPPNTTIDRIDNDGNYEPGNCKWSSNEQQAVNRRTSLEFITYLGETRSLSEWSRILGIDYQKLYRRLKSGWSVERALGK